MIKNTRYTLVFYKLTRLTESSRISNKSARSVAVRLHLCLLVKQDIFYEK